MTLLYASLVIVPTALALEAGISAVRHLHLWKWRDAATNLFIYVVFSGILVGWTGVAYYAYELAAQHAPFDLTPTGPLGARFPWAPWVLLLILEDLTFYLFHRASHRVRFLWAAHQVHHSSTSFNLTTALRQSWLPFVAIPFWLPLPLLGFAPEDVLGVQLGSLLFQFFLHTELIPSYGPLDAILNSPRHHRVHHGLDEPCIDRNFGGIFIVWDRLFGSFARFRPTAYGAGDPVPRGPFSAELGPWVQLGRDVVRAPRWSSKLWSLFGPPEYHPPEKAIS